MVPQALAVGLLMREIWGNTALKIRQVQTDTPKFPAAIYRITMYSHVKRYMYGVGLIDAKPAINSFAWLQVIVRHIVTSRFDIYRLPII